MGGGCSLCAQTSSKPQFKVNKESNHCVSPALTIFYALAIFNARYAQNGHANLRNIVGLLPSLELRP